MVKYSPLKNSRAAFNTLSCLAAAQNQTPRSPLYFPPQHCTFIPCCHRRARLESTTQPYPLRVQATVYHFKHASNLLQSIKIHWCQRLHHTSSSSAHTEGVDIPTCQSLKRLPAVHLCTHLEEIRFCWFF